MKFKLACNICRGEMVHVDHPLSDMMYECLNCGMQTDCKDEMFVGLAEACDVCGAIKGEEDHHPWCSVLFPKRPPSSPVPMERSPWYLVPLLVVIMVAMGYAGLAVFHGMVRLTEWMFPWF